MRADHSMVLMTPLVSMVSRRFRLFRWFPWFPKLVGRQIQLRSPKSIRCCRSVWPNFSGFKCFKSGFIFLWCGIWFCKFHLFSRGQLQSQINMYQILLLMATVTQRYLRVVTTMMMMAVVSELNDNYLRNMSKWLLPLSANAANWPRAQYWTMQFSR